MNDAIFPRDFGSGMPVLQKQYSPQVLISELKQSIPVNLSAPEPASHTAPEFLVIDHKEEGKNLIGFLFKKLGYSFEVVDSLELALARLKSRSYRLIFLELDIFCRHNLHALSSIAVLEKNLGRNTPIIGSQCREVEAKQKAWVKNSLILKGIVQKSNLLDVFEVADGFCPKDGAGSSTEPALIPEDTKGSRSVTAETNPKSKSKKAIAPAITLSKNTAAQTDAGGKKRTKKANWNSRSKNAAKADYGEELEFPSVEFSAAPAPANMAATASQPESYESEVATPLAVLSGNMKNMLSCLKLAVEEKDSESVFYVTSCLQECCRKAGLVSIKRVADQMLLEARANRWTQVANLRRVVNAQCDAAVSSLLSDSAVLL